MHVRVRTFGWLVLVWLGCAGAAHAQVPGQVAADSIGSTLRALTARMDSIEAGTCPSGPAIMPPGRSGEPRTDSLVAVIETLSQRLEMIRAGRCASAPGAAPAAPAPATPDPADDLAALWTAGGAARLSHPPPGHQPRSAPSSRAANATPAMFGLLLLVAFTVRRPMGVSVHAADAPVREAA